MSLKGVELQIAIPKTFDAGKVVEQQQQHIANQQMHANEALKREVERQQTIVNETEGLMNIDGDEEKKREQEREEQERKKKLELAKKKAKHPFKGNFVDFSGWYCIWKYTKKERWQLFPKQVNACVRNSEVWLQQSSPYLF